MGVLQGKLSGPVWLSGGAFGAEGSLIAVCICLAMGVLLLWRTVKADRIQPAFWARKIVEAQDAESALFPTAGSSPA